MLLKNLSLKKKRRFGDLIAEYVIKSVSFTSFAFIVLIFVFVFRESLPAFQTVVAPDPDAPASVQETYGDESASTVKDAVQSNSLESAGSEGEATLSNLLGDEWQPVSTNPKYGFIPLIIGSLKISIIAILIAAPIGILAALFTAAFASPRLKEVLKPAIELLAGFPSVVIGFFALIVLATFVQDMLGLEYRLNAFVGGLALSLAVVPIVYTISEDALAAVPKSYSEASLALGASKWQTILFVVFPAATPGVFAAVLLGIGRAFGETMIVLMATGNAALLSLNPFEPIRTMSATVGAEMAEVVFGGTHYGVLFLIGSVLFIFTFALNAFAELFVRQRLTKRFRGE